MRGGWTRRGVISALPGAMLAGQALAQPSQELKGPTVFETGSPDYHTASFTLPGPEGGSDDFIEVAWPKRGTPKPDILYALDGRAVAEFLTPERLAVLAAQGGPAIVAVGYSLKARFATMERARDYTPPGPDGAHVPDPRGRPGGGAAEFRERLVREILPRAESYLPQGAGRRALWGHSYGGLFSLWEGMRAEPDFDRVIAASPALWWNDGAFWHDILAQLETPPVPRIRIDLHRGGAERERASRPDNAAAQGVVAMRDRLPADASAQLDAALRGAGVAGETRVFPGLSHGEAFSASLAHTLGLDAA
ncbi:alpha/beta hydrolase [Mangrovicoccus algicola]|uniref:Alpha/beta hydrolase n=1 Tax=Mangrovicoccus algicola TaxID=2771008 RepID=A0A8J6Z499_9RHOB|nr:alpha/beta hydrolase-fold protein [Mangrovicoccus algicola]MBE3637269.1 alpha/beta hydrolase [Mangrovicoccus algicola]